MVFEFGLEWHIICRGCGNIDSSQYIQLFGKTEKAPSIQLGQETIILQLQKWFLLI